MKERLASLISGEGTTAAEIVKAVQSGSLPIEIACVISSVRAAPGMRRMRELGLPGEKIVLIEQEAFRVDGKTGSGFGSALLSVLQDCGATVVTQNGWMAYTPEIVINAFRNRIFNQHPMFKQIGGRGMKGVATHAALLEFQRLSGRTFDSEVIVQRADLVMDGGAIVKRAIVPVLPGDTPELLSDRGRTIEHRTMIEFLHDVANGRVTELSDNNPVQPHEMHWLEEAMRAARIRYPNG